MSSHEVYIDFKKSILLWPYWTLRAKTLFGLRYRDTILGSLWPILTVSFVVVAIGLIWGQLLGKESIKDYLSYLLAGFIVWNFLSTCIDQGAKKLTAKDLLGVPLMGVVIFERWWFSVISLLSLSPLVLLLLIMTPWYPERLMIIVIAVASIIAWSLGVVITLTILISVRPDLQEVVRAIMRLAFLATPIIWEVSRLDQYEAYIWLNPFYPPLSTMRHALLGELPQNVYLSFGICLFVLVFSILVFLIGYRPLKKVLS